MGRELGSCDPSEWSRITESGAPGNGGSLGNLAPGSAKGHSKHDLVSHAKPS